MHRCSPCGIVLSQAVVWFPTLAWGIDVPERLSVASPPFVSPLAHLASISTVAV